MRFVVCRQRALSLLAHRGAVLDRRSTPPSIVRGNGRPLPIAAELADALSAEGLVEPSAEATAGSSRLSAKGRAAARRSKALSQAERARPQGRAEPAAAPAVASGPLTAPEKSESVLGWLRRRRDRDGEPLITAEQLSAGERLAADVMFAGLMPRTTSSWNMALPAASGGSVVGNVRAELSDATIDARSRVNRALEAVGPELAGLLLDVCCFGCGLEDMERRAALPARSGKVALLFGLTLLARHYGLVPRHGRHWPGRSGVRHWGTADYRPTLDGAD